LRAFVAKPARNDLRHVAAIGGAEYHCTFTV
jgi:hypothetical protein